MKSVGVNQKYKKKNKIHHVVIDGIPRKEESERKITQYFVYSNLSLN